MTIGAFPLMWDVVWSDDNILSNNSLESIRNVFVATSLESSTIFRPDV